MPLLNQRKQWNSFTISRAEATHLAHELAVGITGKTLVFQSSANRNWVVKLARQMYGVNIDVYAEKDVLINPGNTVEGKGEFWADSHYMTAYKAVKLAVRSHISYDAPASKPGWLYGFDANNVQQRVPVYSNNGSVSRPYRSTRDYY